jgi:hypothetical protein
MAAGRTRHDPAIIVANGRSRNAKAVLYVGSVYLATWHFFVPNHQHDPLHRLPTSTIAHSAGSQHRTPSPLHCLRREPASGLRGFRMEPASTMWAVSCSDLDTYVINFNARARSIEVARKITSACGNQFLYKRTVITASQALRADSTQTDSSAFITVLPF